MKRRLVYTSSTTLESNYVSSENNTNIPAASFTGEWISVVQYNSVRVTVNSDVGGTLEVQFTDFPDGGTITDSVSSTVIGGTPFFSIFPIEATYFRNYWHAGSTPTQLDIYTTLSKSAYIPPTGSGGVSDILTVNANPPMSVTDPAGPDTTINIEQATALQDGYLTSTDWNTFNSKGDGTVTQVGVTAPLTVTNPTGPIVSLAIPAATSSNNGYLTATDWTTFNSKGTGNGTLSNVQGSGVITSSNPPGPSTTISISQATTSTSGYLSSTDWNTFNSKGAGTLQSVSGDGHTISSSNPTGPNTIISQPQATAFVDGYLNAADWLSFYLKQDATTFTAGTGITISGTSTAPVFTNSKPDQTVAIASGTGISATGTYPNFTVTNTAPDQTVAITAGTGITRTGTYPNFTITNSAPDQTVAITAGTGISVTGTYPNFTVASTGSSGNPTAFSSYGIFTQAPASLPASVSVVTATSTTVSKTSDWTNSGSGRYTFTGASPMKFRVEVSLNFTSATSNVKNFCVARNGVYPPTQAVLQAVDIHELPAVDNYITPANTAYGRMFRSLTTFSMFNGDYLELVSYVQSASMSVTTWNIKIYNCEY